MMISCTGTIQPGTASSCSTVGAVRTTVWDIARDMDMVAGMAVSVFPGGIHIT